MDPNETPIKNICENLRESVAETLAFFASGRLNRLLLYRRPGFGLQYAFYRLQQLLS